MMAASVYEPYETACEHLAGGAWIGVSASSPSAAALGEATRSWAWLRGPMERGERVIIRIRRRASGRIWRYRIRALIREPEGSRIEIRAIPMDPPEVTV